MKNEKFDKQGIIKRLIGADEDASLMSFTPFHVKVILVGGSVLLLKDLRFDATPDIDALTLDNNLRNIFDKYDINDRANAHSDGIPYNYEDRLEKVDITTHTIEYYNLSLEDLVIMKLHSGREKDWKDVTNFKVVNKLDWDLMDYLVKNELDHISNTNLISMFKYNYDRYIKEYKKK